MTDIPTSMKTTMNPARPTADQTTQENDVAQRATYGSMPTEWARTVATLSAVNRVLLAGGQRLMGQQMELAHDIARDMMADTQGDRVQRSYRRVIAYGAELSSLLHGSNCEIAAIVGQHLMESINGQTESVEKALASAR